MSNTEQGEPPRPRVWVVDDSATARHHLERVLGDRFEIDAFADGPTMIERLAAGPPPQLVLLDVEMPLMSGHEVSRFVRSRHDEIALPILMVTVSTEPLAARDALAAGANDIVRRPFESAELLARISNLLMLGKLADLRVASLRALFAQVPAVIAHLRGPDHLCDMANPAYLAMVGKREVVGVPLRDALPGLMDTPILDILDRVYATGEPAIANETRVRVDRHGTGALSEVFLNFTYQPTRDVAGAVDGIFVHAVDVTDGVRAKQRARVVTAERERLHRQSERARELAESQRAQLSALFAQAPVAIAVMRGPAYIVELANPHVCALWGRAEPEVLGKPLFEALPEIAGQGLEELLAGVVTTGVAYVGTELLVRVARGPSRGIEDVYFNFVYQPMRDGSSAVEAVLVVAIDVTESVRIRRDADRLAAALREREERLRLALAASEAGAWEVDLGTRRIDADPIVRDLFNVPAGQDFPLALALARMHPEDRARVSHRIERAIAGDHGGVYHEQYRLVGDGGEITWIDARGQALFDATGAARRFLGTLLDISDRKQTEALREALFESERRGREVAEQQRDFEQYLVGIVSHDLRTPLQAISLGTELLLRADALDARTTKSLVRVKTNADRATRLIRDVLDFTQVRLGGGIKPRLADVDLGELVRETIDELRIAEPLRELILTMTGDSRGTWDADRLAQVVTNLVTNAFKYSPPDTMVTVAVTGGADDVELAVHNVGSVIPAAQIPQLFRPMQRHAQDERNLQRSVGLGLYIVDHIATIHGGRVGVTSTQDGGTTFRVVLPKSGSPASDDAG